MYMSEYVAPCALRVEATEDRVAAQSTEPWRMRRTTLASHSDVACVGCLVGRTVRIHGIIVPTHENMARLDQRVSSPFTFRQPGADAGSFKVVIAKETWTAHLSIESCTSPIVVRSTCIRIPSDLHFPLPNLTMQ